MPDTGSSWVASAVPGWGLGLVVHADTCAGISQDLSFAREMLLLSDAAQICITAQFSHL